MLQEFLSEHKADLVGEWFERIITRYPPETARFLRDQENRFANPVGAGLREELSPLYDGLVEGSDSEDLCACLDRVLRIRAVQDMAPSEALGFLFDLKPMIRERLHVAGIAGGRELEELELRIDRLVLAAVDVYVGCRDQMFKIQIKTIRNLSLNRMEQLNEWRARRDGLRDSDPVEPE